MRQISERASVSPTGVRNWLVRHGLRTIRGDSPSLPAASKIKAEAKRLGQTWYLTGRPCKHGHLCRRRMASGACFECGAILMRDQRAERPITRLLQYSRQRARETGMEHTITLADVVMPDGCPACGLPFDFQGHVDKAKRKPRSATFDRFDNALGYVPGNVFVICADCNTRKSSATVADLKLIVAWMERVIEERNANRN